MASVFSVTTEAEEALGAATAETVLQLRGSTATKAKLVGWGISFDGATSTDAPVVVELLRQSTDGTATAATEVEWDEDGPTANVTSFHSFTAEPTAGSVLEAHEVHPQGGGIIRDYQYGREPVIGAAATSRLAIRATAPAAVNCQAFMIWEE